MDDRSENEVTHLKDTEIIAAIRMGDGTAIAHAMDRYGRLLWKVVGAVIWD